MTDHRIQSLSSLEEEMKAVARGETPAPPDAAAPSFESVETLARLLTPENRRLMAMIRDRKPQSVAELAELAGRAEPNLLRTLDKLRAAGLVRMDTAGRRKVPTVAVGRIIVDIDPYSANDHMSIEPA